MIIGFVVIVLIFMPHISSAVELDLFGQQINVTGHITQEFAFSAHTDKAINGKHYDEPGLHSAYFTFYIDSTIWLTQNIHIRIINRLLGDWIYSIKRSNKSWKKRLFTRSNTPLHLELTPYDIIREFYINWMSEHLSIRIGKQQIAWGEADGIRLCDIINPLDISREGPFRDCDEGYEGTRIPLFLIRMNYTLGGKSLGPIWRPEIEFVFNPGDIRTTRIFDNSIWSYHLPILPSGLNIKIIDGRKSRTLDHNEWGFRLKGYIWDTFVTLNFWRGYLHDPVLRTVYFDPFTMTLILKKVYPKINSYGFTATRELYWFRKIFKGQINPVWRIELLYQQNYPYNTQFLGNSRNELNEKDVIRYMLGLDWPVWIKFINKEKNIFISAQLFHYHIINYPHTYKLQVGAYNDWIAREDQFYSSFILKTSYFHDFLKPQVLTVMDWTYGTWWLKPKVKFEIGNNWRPEVGAIFVFAGADDYRREFGHWADRDEVYIKMTYQF